MELVEAARNGDRFALDQLLRRHYDRIHAVTRRIASGSRDADDACQEALIKIVKHLPSFDGRSSFSTWAYRIATNAALDELRKRRRRPMLHAIESVGDETPPEQRRPDPVAHRQVDAVADRLALGDAFDELDDDFRSAVVLRDVADLDYAEIAEVLDVPVGTVKSRIARGRRQLADQLRIDELPAVDTDATTPLPTDGLGIDRENSRRSGNRTAPDERPNDST
ncbi:MAG: RNA polymerase sigma factor [Actinomycetota bacterium]